MTLNALLAASFLTVIGNGAVAQQVGPAAEKPGLDYAFSARVGLFEPVEQGTVNGLRMRFVPISGGKIQGPKLNGTVLPGGGDWQSISPDGLTEVNALYNIRADDGTVIAIRNAGVRTASAEVTKRMAAGEEVRPDDYYMRTSARFTVEAGPHDWMNRTMFVVRGIRMPDHVVMDFYEVK